MDCILIFPPKSFTTVFFQELKHGIIQTCEGHFAQHWACCSLRPSPFCWPAGPPRPSSYGCSSLEEFLPRGSSERHLLLEWGKAWGDHILMSNNKAFLNKFSKLLFSPLVFGSRFFSPPPLGGRNLRDTVQTIFSSSNVQRRVTVDIDGLQITVGVQEQLWDVHTARECCPVKADVLFLRHETS